MRLLDYKAKIHFVAVVHILFLFRFYQKRFNFHFVDSSFYTWELTEFSQIKLVGEDLCWFGNKSLVYLKKCKETSQKQKFLVEDGKIWLSGSDDCLFYKPYKPLKFGKCESNVFRIN